MSLLTNIVAYWKLDESSGNATDATGNGFTLTNTNTVVYNTGIINNGADFGSNNTTNHKYLTISNNLGIDGGNITMSCWFFRTGTNNNRVFFGCGSLSSRVLYHMTYNNGVVLGRWKVPTTDALTSAATFSTDTWHHIVLTYDGSTLAGYLDNVPITGVSTSGSGTSVLTSETAFGGYPQVNSNEFINGKMDEVGIWSRVLTSGEVSTLYNGGVGLQYPFSPAAPAAQPSFLINFC